MMTFSYIKKIRLILSFILLAGNTQAQTQKLKFSIGPEFSVPAFPGITSSGLGAGFGVDHFFNKKTALAINISFSYFRGNILDTYKHDTINGFTVVPVLAGGKYFFSEKFYVSASAGLVIGVHNAGNHLALSPGTGILIPVSATSKIDFGVRWTGVPTGYSFSENSFLNKGGYSFVTFKIAYAF